MIDDLGMNGAIPSFDLPDTSGADLPPPPAPLSLPDTHGAHEAVSYPSAADQALPQPTQAAPNVDPVAARPGDPNQAPITPPVSRPPAGEWRKGAMDPRHVYGMFLSEVEKQGLVGLVPTDGASYGIRTGSAKEWAAFLTGLAAHESGLKNETVGDVGQFRGGSRGLLQLSYDDAQNYGLNGGQPFSPEQLADPAQNAAAGVAIIKKLVSGAGSIRGGAGKYWGPITRENWTPGNGRDRDLPWSDFGGTPLIQATGKVELHTGTAPSFAPAGSPEAAVEANKIAAFKPAPGFWQTVEAAADETTTAYLFRHSPIFAPDPGYQPTNQELELRKQGLPEKYWDRLVGVSSAHSDYLTQQAQRQFANEVTLSEAGWTGTGIGLVTSIVDPVDLGVGIASGGLGAFAGGAAKVGKLGQKLWAAGGGALGNVALTGAGDALGRATEGSDYAYAAAWGAGLGFAFGPLVRNPATEDIANAGAYAAGKAMADYARGVPRFSGGEGTLSAAPAAVENVKLSKGDLMSIADADVSRTSVERLRPDMAGRGGASDNPLMRAMSQALGLDVVGRVGPDGAMAVNPFSAGEDKLRIMGTANARVYSVAYPQFEEWAKERGVNWMKLATPRMTQEWEDFANLVTAHRRDLRADRDAHYDPQVVKASRELGTVFEGHRQGNIAPRPETPGNPGRPLAGMENVPPNPHYMPRVWRLDKIMAVDASGRKFIEWMEGAILSAHMELGDKAETLARGIYSGIVRRGFNLDEFAMMARDGGTADVLRSGMLDLGISEADVAEILARLPKGSKPGFTHLRLDLDETFTHPRTGLKLGDFTETNAFDLFDHYNHQASAWQAAGRIQIVRANGEVLLDGIRSRKEVAEVLAQVADKGYQAGLLPKQIEDDTALLREMLDRLFGVPHEKAASTLAQGAEIVRNLATAASGGNFGISALPDMARVATIGGLRALLQHVPGFRTHIVEGGILRPRDPLAMDIAAFGAVDEFRHLSPRRLPEDGLLTSPMQGAMAKIGGASKVLADAVVGLSGLNIINRYVRETARRVMASRFYRDAEEVFASVDAGDLNRLSPTERNRMKWFGLDDDMLARVLRQVREHGETADHWTGAKLSRLHPEDWTDSEAKHAFVMALNRAAGRASTEHDFGAGTVWDRSPIFRTFSQLRRFGLNAWHMNIQHGYAMRDPEVFWDVVASSFAAATLYAVRTRIEAATRPDPDKHLQERLAPGAFAAATFQLGAFSSLIPAVVDTGIGMAGANPLFGFRNSALPSDAWFGNPSVTLLNNAFRVAPSALFQPIVAGRDRSQQEWRQLLSVLPFSNNIAVQSALGVMVRGAPKYAPKNQTGYSISDAILGSVH